MKKCTWTLALSLVASLLTACPARAFDSSGTGSGLLYNCLAALRGNIESIVEGMDCDEQIEKGYVSLMHARIMAKQDEACTPDNVSKYQARQIVVSYLKKNTHLLQNSQESVIRAALTQAFPCKAIAPTTTKEKTPDTSVLRVYRNSNGVLIVPPGMFTKKSSDK